MEAGPFYSRSMTMERSVRESHTDGGITAFHKLAVEHENEKRELQSLNEKFASYLSKVRQLEAQNRQLEAEVNEIRKKWGFETADIRRQFDKDLDDLRSRIDDAEGKKALSQVRLKSAAYNADIVRSKIDFLEALADSDKQKLQMLLQQRDMFQPEMNALDGRYKDMQAEIERLRGDLQMNLSRLEEFLKDLDNNTFDRVRLENQIQTLKDQLVFLKALYEEEIKEVQSLAIPHFDVSQFYRTELTKAITDIRKDFETLSKAQQSEIQSYYTVRMDEIRQQVDKEKQRMEEAKKRGHVEVMDFSSLRDTLQTTAKEKGDLEMQNDKLMALVQELERDVQERRVSREHANVDMEAKLAQLNGEIELIRNSLQAAAEENVSLRFEINTYRRLLEWEEAYLVAAHGADTRAYGNSAASSVRANAYGAESPANRGSRGGSYAGPASAYEWYGIGELASPSHHKRAVDGASPKKRVLHNKLHTGPIDLDENEMNEECLSLKNDSGNDVDIGGWCIYQRDGVRDIRYFLPHNLRLRPHSTLKIYSKSGAGRTIPSENVLVAEYVSKWLTGPRVETIVQKPDNSEAARIVSEWLQ